MKIWVDDNRPAPDGYFWARSVNETIDNISLAIETGVEIELLDLDHDAGDYFPYGGDYIRILDWMEENGANIPVRIHSMNPVGRANMKIIIDKNGWNA